MSKLEDAYKNLQEKEENEEGQQLHESEEELEESKKSDKKHDKKDDLEEGKYKKESEDEDEEDEEDDEDDEDEEDDEVVEKKTTKKKKMMKEDFDKLFEGTDLNEDFQVKATTLIEAYVSDRVSIIEEELQEKFNNQLEEEKKELNENADKYLSYMAQQWLEENQIAVQNSLKLEALESFIEGMKTLFEDHYFDVPEAKRDLVEELIQEKNEISEKLNKALEENIDLKMVNEQKDVEKRFENLSEGLTVVEKDKLFKLQEHLSYEDLDEYETKVKILRETYFGEGETKTPDLNEETEFTKDKKEKFDPRMEQYLSFAEHL